MNFLQLRLYAAAAERLGLEPVNLAIHDLGAGEGRRHVFGNDDRELGAFAMRLEAWLEGIRGGAYPPGGGPFGVFGL